MSPLEAAAFLADLADRVQKIHGRGQVLGDFSPTDVELVDAKRLCIRGLPLAMGTGAIKRVGTAVSPYTAPEWLEQKGGSDSRGDIYILGVILYQMLTGVLPFQSQPGSPALVQEILAGSPAAPCQIDPSIPATLEEICLKAMARNPAARYATAGTLAAALRKALKPKGKAFWK